MSPTGSNSGVTPQLIQDGQQNNFISPKYSISSLANANTEDSTPGYSIKVFKSTSTDSGSLSSGDIVSSNDYQFDFKMVFYNLMQIHQVQVKLFICLFISMLVLH